MNSTELDDAADRHKFVLVSPDGGIPHLPLPGPIGLPYGLFWHVPGSPMVGGLPVPPGSRDDERFLLDVVRQIRAKTCADRRRIWVTGASNGAMMASAMICRHPNVFAAAVPVMGVRAGYPGAPCRPSRTAARAVASCSCGRARAATPGTATPHRSRSTW